MGYHFEFDSGNNLLRLSWQGRITDQLLLEGVGAGLRLVSSLPSRRVIDDYSGVTELDVSSQTIERIARMSLTPLEGVDLTLVIIAPKDHIFGLARMFSLIEEQRHPNVQVVRTERQAYAVLGIASAQFSPISSS